MGPGNAVGTCIVVPSLESRAQAVGGVQLHGQQDPNLDLGQSHLVTTLCQLLLEEACEFSAVSHVTSLHGDHGSLRSHQCLCQLSSLPS